MQIASEDKADSHLPKTVGIIFSEVKREYFPTEAQYLTEADAYSDAEIVGEYLKKLGIKVFLYPGTPELVVQLQKNNPDMVINLVGSVKGQEYLSATIPGMLESLEIPYTGAGILGESLAYNKFLVKELLQSHGIPVPRNQLFSSASTLLNPQMRFPLITKLNEIHGAVEITHGSISEDEKHLRSRVKYLLETYHQPVLVEEYIVGREIAAFLLEGANKKVYFGEKCFVGNADGYQFASFELQWQNSQLITFEYERYRDPKLGELVKKAFEVLRMYDYGKFDIRIDQSGRYYFIDSNSNPAFGPKESNCPISHVLELYGVTFIEILRRLLLNTMRDAAGKQLLPPVDEKIIHESDSYENH